MQVYENIVGNGENAGSQHFLLLPTIIQTHSKSNFIFEPYSFCLANALNLDWCKILLLGKELTDRVWVWYTHSQSNQLQFKLII